jgi:hypothetical protein
MGAFADNRFGTQRPSCASDYGAKARTTITSRRHPFQRQLERTCEVLCSQARCVYVRRWGRAKRESDVPIPAQLILTSGRLCRFQPAEVCQTAVSSKIRELAAVELVSARKKSVVNVIGEMGGTRQRRLGAYSGSGGPVSPCAGQIGLGRRLERHANHGR